MTIKTVKEFFLDNIDGTIEYEYSDESLQKFNLKDTVIATVDSSTGVITYSAGLSQFINALPTMSDVIVYNLILSE